MDLKYEKYQCIACGLHRADRKSSACPSCWEIRISNIRKFLSFIRWYAINGLLTVESLVSNGKNFLGSLIPPDYARLDELKIPQDDIHDVVSGKLSLVAFLKKHQQKRSDRFVLLKLILKAKGVKGRYLPYDDPHVRPAIMSAPVILDEGDKMVGEAFLATNPGDLMELGRQTANKIYYSGVIARLRGELSRGETSKDAALEEAIDIWESCQRNKDHWSAPEFRDFFKYVGRLDLHSAACDLALSAQKPLIERFNEHAHV